MRPLLRTIHLWTGLVFGTLLVLQGLTGTALAWRHELDHLLNPGLLQVAPPPGLRAGDPVRIAPATAQAAADRLERDTAFGKPNMLMFPERAGDVFIAWYRPAPSGSSWDQPVTRQVMLDPATLAVLGERNWGEAGLSRPLLMPTLFHLHRYLMAGDSGKVIVAVEGLALLLTAITGMIVWWPKMTASAFVHALKVRYGGSWPRFSFQLHRSAGFFLAPVFAVSAFSGIHFNMPAWTTPVINTAATLAPNGKVSNRSDASLPRIAPQQALEAAQAAFPDARISRLSFAAGARQPYEVRVRQPGEVRKGDGATRISIDAGNGMVLKVVDPLRSRGGDKVVSWLFPLHTGEAFGVAGRIFISLFGMAPLLFFVTGVVVWLKFRRKAKQPSPRAVARASAVLPKSDSRLRGNDGVSAG